LENIVCKHCGVLSKGNYCFNCGQSFLIKRITISGIMHEVVHLFTHLDKGFLYTLRKLITRPGKMQKEYVEGDRLNHQRPFSMFFLCTTAAALIYYWINLALIKYYRIGDESTIFFFQHYMVIVQILLLPAYAGITWLIFYNSKYNYAEVVVLMLYLLSVLLLMAALIQPLRFIWPDLETRYIELPLIVFYGVITNIFFFDKQAKPILILKSMLPIVVAFFLAGFTQDLLIKLLS
jgi:Protein of unknown function (DUF3667)